MGLSRRLWTLLLVLLLSGCGEVSPPPSQSPAPAATPTPTPQPVEFALGYDSGDDLHPFRGNSRLNLEWMPLVYRGLYRLDNTFVPQPELAAGATVDDSGQVWTVELARAFFSDGTRLTGDVVAASLLAARSSPVYGTRLQDVAAVEPTPDNGGVLITLSRPNGVLPTLLDVPIVLERAEGLPLGTGPYVCAEGEMVLYPNLLWWGEQTPTCRRIPLRDIPSPDRHIAAFDSGEIAAVSTDLTGAGALGYSGTYETHDYPTTQMLYVGFQTADGRPCAQPELRLALSRAMDRSSVLTSMLSGHGTAATLPLSPLHPDYDAELAATLDYDIAAARQLLAGLGYTAGEDGILRRGRNRLSLTLVVNNDSATRMAIADYLAGSFRELGVDIQVQMLAWADYQQALRSGAFDLFLGEVRLTGDFDIQPLVTGELNCGSYTSRAVADGLEKLRPVADDILRRSLRQELFGLLAEELPFAPLCFKNHSLLLRWGMLSGVEPTRGDLLGDPARWQMLEP